MFGYGLVFSRELRDSLSERSLNVKIGAIKAKNLAFPVHFLKDLF